MKIFCNNCSKVFDAEIPEGAAEIPCPGCSGAIKVPESPLSPGAVIGDFLLEKSLSSGGMGVVYLARQISLDRPVALKVLRDKFANDQEYVEGLFHEARAAAKLTHPNIVQAYAVGEENGVFYFAMEYIRGETFKQILKKQNILEIDQAIKVIREICSALQAAWNEQKLVHQDIKPDNIMLDSNGFAKLADLGLARSANTDSGPGEDETEVMGTPQYISPEQLTGVPTDVRSDIYSLGATFYQFVTGQFPYPEENAEAMARKHVEGNLTPPIEVNPDLPKPLNDIIVKMMARHIEERYQMPNEVIADLDAYIELRKISNISVPKLKLNLNKKGAKPAAPPAAKPAAPPAAKPAAPPAVKPAAPPAAKPAAPPAAKPAAPPAAKPAAPPAAKPAEDPAAKPAAPPAAKPAAPPAAKPAEDPAAKPAEEKPAIQVSEGEDIVLSPKKAKSQTENGETANPEASEKDKKQEKKSKKAKRGGSVGKIIAFIIIFPLVLIAIAAALFLTAQKGHLGEKGKKIAASVSNTLGIKKSAPAETAQKSTPQKVTPPPKPVSVTRKEFIAEIDRLISLYRVNPSKNAPAFLQGADQFTARFTSPVTKEEKEAFQSLFKIYNSMDEVVRAVPYRKSAIQKIEERLKAQKEREAKELAAKKEQEEREKRIRELAKNQLGDQGSKKIAQETEKRIRKLQSDFSVLYRNLATAFLKSVRTNDPSHYKKIVATAAESPFTAANSTQKEYDMEEEYRNFRDVFLNKAFKQFEDFYKAVGAITPSNSFSMGDYLEFEVIKVQPPKVIYKSKRGERVLRLSSKKRRTEFYKHLVRKTKLKYAPFFFEIIEGRIITPFPESQYPSREWRRHLKHLTPPLKALPSRPVRKKR